MIGCSRCNWMTTTFWQLLQGSSRKNWSICINAGGGTCDGLTVLFMSTQHIFHPLLISLWVHKERPHVAQNLRQTVRMDQNANCTWTHQPVQTCAAEKAEPYAPAEASWMRRETSFRNSSKSSCLGRALRYKLTRMTDSLYQHNVYVHVHFIQS